LVEHDLHTLLFDLRDEACAFYGSRLVSLCVYGSVARGTYTRASDIDLLIVAHSLPDGRCGRMREFEAVESRLSDRLSLAAQRGCPADLSPVFKTPQEARRLGTIFLDMTLEREILFDRDKFLEALLEDLSARLRAAGAHRAQHGDLTYWVLVPSLSPGESWSL
jgi:predicted nucleotidyltransferase